MSLELVAREHVAQPLLAVRQREAPYLNCSSIST